MSKWRSRDVVPKRKFDECFFPNAPLIGNLPTWMMKNAVLSINWRSLFAPQKVKLTILKRSPVTLNHQVPENDSVIGRHEIRKLPCSTARWQHTRKRYGAFTYYTSSFCINSPVGWVTHVASQYEHYTPEVCFITNPPEKLPGPKKRTVNRQQTPHLRGEVLTFKLIYLFNSYCYCLNILNQHW